MDLNSESVRASRVGGHGVANDWAILARIKSGPYNSGRTANSVHHCAQSSLPMRCERESAEDHLMWLTPPLTASWNGRR